MDTTSSPFDKRQGYRVLLKNKNFLSLWLGQIFSQLGDRVVFVVFVAVIAHAFGSSTSIQSWLYVAFTIPAILLTAVAGVFIDRWNKKATLIITNIIRAIIIGLLPFVDSSLYSIYALAFLLSAVTQFFVPTEASIIPMMVNKYQLLTANSIFTTTMMASIIFGFALGDPLINIFGLKSVHISIALMFLISAACLAFIKYKPSDKESEKHRTVQEFFADLKDGFVYTKGQPKVYHAMFKLATLFSIIVTLSILSISISQQYLYPNNAALGAQKFVYIVAFSGIGMVLGSVIVGKFLRDISKYKLIYSGFTIMGVGLVLLALLNHIPNEIHFKFTGADFWKVHLEPFDMTTRMVYTYVIGSIIGFSSSLISIPVQTIMHTSVIEEMRGKVFGLQFTLLSTASTFPVIIAAFGADFFGVLKMLMIVGLPILLFGLYNLLRTNNKILVSQ